MERGEVGAKMIGWPKTRAQAEAYRYNMWAGNPKGWDFDPERCAAEVSDGTGWHWVQCSRRPGKGPDGLYCGQHAKKAVKE